MNTSRREKTFFFIKYDMISLINNEIPADAFLSLKWMYLLQLKHFSLLNKINHGWVKMRLSEAAAAEAVAVNIKIKFYIYIHFPDGS